jgi:hypothetical protein
MDTSRHDLSSLFLQLGLASNPAEVDAFVATHHLDQRMRLCDAPFWNKAQAQFLRESLEQDSDWSEAADELARLLSPKAKA